MKKSLLLVFVALMSVFSASAADTKTANIPVINATGLTLDKALKVQTASRMHKAPKKVAPTALAASYIGDAMLYSSQTWSQAESWEVTPGTATYEGVDYDVIYDVLPPTVFNSAIDFTYEVEGNNLVMYPEPLTSYQTYYVYAMDYSDFASGGTGAIVLELGADGSLQIPEANEDHVYGYFACSYNRTTYAPTKVAGAFQQCADLTYTLSNGTKPALKYDTDSDIDVQFTLDQVGDIEYDSEYEEVFLVADNNEGVQFITEITFLENNVDADIVVPAGTYPTAKGYDNNTIIASSGYNATYGPIPTFVATYDEDDYYEDFWFIVEGELNVEKIKMEDGSVKMYMELTGKNSYDRNVHVVIGDRVTTGISNAQVVEKKTVKVVRDGKINILNGMRKYDAAGKTLK